MPELLPIVPIPAPPVPVDWDFESADKSFDERIAEWRRLSPDVVSTLWVFYNKLKRQGDRTDLVTDDTRLPTWERWIGAKGISRMTAYRHFQKLGWLPDSEPVEPLLLGTVEGRYSILYADPPWSYSDKAIAGNGRWAGAENHYPCMDLGAICALEMEGRTVSEFAADDAVLFLWATFPMLPSAMAVIAAWGFEYKTAAFVWIKKYADGSPALGLGNYTRQNAEVCLLAKRGKGVERKSASISSVIESPRMEHSRKPGVVRDRIIELLGDLPRIELFGREKIEGWDVWGNEAHQEPLRFNG